MTDYDSADSTLDIPPLVLMGHPLLGQPSWPVAAPEIGTSDLNQRVQTLVAAMHAYQGIGIAAPQIGWFERFFVMMESQPDSTDMLEEEAEDSEDNQELLAWINPEILRRSPEECWAWEGCLSVPGMRGWIKRPAAVQVRGFNRFGEMVSRDYSGWNARVFQHEFDHLEGFLFPYRALDPRHLIFEQELARREQWPNDWPAAGAKNAPYGLVIPA